MSDREDGFYSQKLRLQVRLAKIANSTGEICSSNVECRRNVHRINIETVLVILHSAILDSQFDILQIPLQLKISLHREQHSFRLWFELPLEFHKGRTDREFEENKFFLSFFKKILVTVCCKTNPQSPRGLTPQGPRSKFSTGGAKGERLSVSQLGVGGGGVRGHAPPENFDFNSSKMTGNAFKNNKRNV